METSSLSRILIVDDDDWIISGVSVALSKAGFELCSARDGQEGLEVAHRKRPDLVIADVIMPRMDGWAFVRQLRSQPDFSLVPVIFLTSKSSAQDRITGFQLGADDYLAKPVNFQELPRRIMKALAHRRQLEKDLALPSPPVAGGKGLKGTLDQVGMATLLGMLSAGRHSGILRVTGRLLRDEVLVYLVRGQIYRVEVQGKGRLTGEEAQQQLFRWMEGGFEFSPMKLRISNEVNVPMNTLLLQGALQGPASPKPF